MADVISQVNRILEPILSSLGLTLWDMEFKKEGPQWLLRIYIDREGPGVSLDDCEAVSRDLGTALDVEDFIPHTYRLEVSSPGLDRSLTKPEHYRSCAGKAVKIKTFQPVEGEKVLRGKIKASTDASVTIESEKGSTLEIPFSNISKASMEVVL